MSIRRKLFFAILTLSIFTTNVFAQAESAAQPQDAASAAATTPAVVTASATGSSVRFAAPAGAVQLRLELYAANGERIFDSGVRQGSVLDWQPTDAPQGAGDGSYLCILTAKDLQGRATQRIATLSLQSGQASVQRVREQELPDAQKQAAAESRREQKSVAAGADNGLTILREGKERALTVAAHDGEDGRITSTKGALTLRTGDILSGQDREQMRITPDGRVGIGTDKPEATLDVAGTIHARGGIRFEDGTVLTSAGAAGRTSKESKNGAAASSTGTASDNVTPSISGTGTTGKIVKWLDGATGQAGDSAMTELSGNIGIGTTTPGTLNGKYFPSLGLHVKGTGQSKYIVVDDSTNVGVLLNDSSQAVDNRLWAIFNKGSRFSVSSFNDAGSPTERMAVLRNGNVGIGTIAPTQKLEVAGGLKLSGAGSSLIFPDGTSMTTAASGGSMSGTNIISAINDAGTTGVINDNRLSANVARINGANAWSGANIFNLGLSANNALITNVGNPVNAGDAVNKAYADANFVKFVPGAEQLSVGDANGTAPMINLRGGSTCCSGPGGHTPAWFKVFQNGSFVATGNLGIGVSPMQGKGYRTSWDSYKGAFRSGYADNEWDDANVGFFSWAGGSNSTAIGLYALAFGDTNSAESTSSIVFGSGNQVKGAAGFSAGAGNRVCDTYGVALGNNAKSGGPLINGKCDPDTFNIRGLAAVAIGYNVTADQDHTTAMGKFASNNGFTGTFIWSDGSAQQTADTFRNTANNEFAARATGGFRFRTNLGGTTGCNLPAGSGVFNCTSSRTTKENFKLASGEDVLARLRKIPVSTWNYTAEGSAVRHMGPMAEDFYEQFELGTGNTSIGVQDLAGVSLAAVKALDQRTAQLQQRTAEVEQLRSEVQSLRAANTTMEQRLAALEQSMQQQERAAKPRTATTARRRR
jgi:hypothetical protein